jgi:hypothetical protein
MPVAIFNFLLVSITRANPDPGRVTNDQGRELTATSNAARRAARGGLELHYLMILPKNSITLHRAVPIAHWKFAAVTLPVKVGSVRPGYNMVDVAV